MATRSVSPGGALLRSSRLFSLPAPLPPPSNPYASTKWNSDTMTTPYPTHQVITTISTSRKNGDWGLKRPLPLKSTTKSSVAMLRVKAIDTIDQITDYASGADHGITLLKFQELGLPIVTQESKHLDRARLSVPDSRQTSVFEDDIDFTAIPDDKARADLVDNRWRFQGPWLAGMPHGEFQKYLETKVRPRRAQFRTFLKEKIAEELNANANQKAMDQGEEELTLVRPGDITNEQVTNYLRKLREDSSNSTLYQIVGQFLDLAPLKPPPFVLDNLSKAGVEVKLSNNPYAEHGPPRTHPSAGLSYLRTKNYIDNHPIYGPQEQLKPVVARFVRPRRQVAGTEPAKFGIAGIVSDVPLGDVKSNQKTGPRGEVSIDNMDVESPGGPKIWVLPNRASIDSEGRVVLNGVMPKVEQELVAKELIGEGDGIFGKDREAEYNRVRENISLNRKRYSQITMSTPKGYGL